MKKIITLGFIVLIHFGCNAQRIGTEIPGDQHIIPVENYVDYLISETEIPKGTYFKDVNNLLDKYVGNWRGIFENKTYDFVIEEFTSEHLGVTADELKMRYKITDSDGTILINTLTLPYESPFIIIGRHFSENSRNYLLYYVGEKVECGQLGTVYINSMSPTQINLVLIPDGDIINSLDCPEGEAAQIFPTETFMSLYKVP